MKSVIRLMSLLLVLHPAFAGDSDSSASKTTIDLNGQWEVFPADSKSISSFVIGKLELRQSGNELSGTYTLKKKDDISTVCSSKTYDVTGHVSGNTVTLNASGSKSRLNGSATGDSNMLKGSGMEFFESIACSGYVTSTFVMKKLPNSGS